MIAINPNVPVALIRWSVILGVILLATRFMTGMPGRSFSGSPPALTGEEGLIEENLKRHVAALAGELGERNVWRPGAIAAAAAYIRKSLDRSGLPPANRVDHG